MTRKRQPRRYLCAMKNATSPRNWPYVLLAGLLALAAAYVLYRINNPPPRTDPWVTYLEVPAAFPVPDEAEIADVVRSFNAGEYQEVSQAVPLLLAADSTTRRPELLYLLGVSFLKTQEAYPAIYQLEKIPTSHPLRLPANYYRAVAYQLTGNRRKARLLLADIVADKTHPDNARAAALLAELDI